VEVLLDRTTPDAFERFKQVMLAHDEVMECHMVAGGFDYLIVRQHHLLEALEGVGRGAIQ